jgi:hypothetical protein
MVKYNDRMANANKRLAEATWEFRETLAPMSKSEPPNLEDVKAAYDKLVVTINDIKEERQKQLPRPDAPVVDELDKAYDAFLQGQEQMILREFVAMVRVAEGPGTLVDKWAKIQVIANQVHAREQKDLDVVQAAQNKVMSDFNLKPVPFR